jgi:hypothetical protein
MQEHFSLRKAESSSSFLWAWIIYHAHFFSTCSRHASSPTFPCARATQGNM